MLDEQALQATRQATGKEFIFLGWGRGKSKFKFNKSQIIPI